MQTTKILFLSLLFKIYLTCKSIFDMWFVISKTLILMSDALLKMHMYLQTEN